MVKCTVEKVVKKHLCTSCGICAGACLKGCISFHSGKERNYPLINRETCISCGICYDVCPGKGIQLNRLSEDYFSKQPDIKKNLCAGYYRHTYVGYSIDDDIRMHCASGGMVTQFLMWLLEKGEIDGAVVVRYKKNDPLEPEAFIATTKEEIWESRSSKYVIVSMDSIAKMVSSGKYKNLAVVGLPCQIQGWRQLADKNKRVKDAIKAYFSIYCSINKTKLSLRYYLQRYHIDIMEIGKFAFRDDGCLGFMKFENKQGEVIKKIPYQSFWFGTHSFFTNPRCHMCIDQLGELADLSFGDIYIKPYSDDKIGINSVVSRSAYWDNLLTRCNNEGTIMLNEISVDILVRSQIFAQNYKKGAGAKAYINILRMIGKKVPSYDYEYDGRINFFNYVCAISKMLMYSIGKRKFLWWFVKLMDRY